MSGKTIYKFHNNWHIGDCILALRFFYNIQSLLKANNINIKFLYNQSYIKENIKELERYSVADTIDLLPIKNNNINNSYDLWMNHAINNINHTKWETYFNAYYTKIISQLQLSHLNINCSLWQQEDYLQDIYKTLPAKYKEIDILVINGTTHSGQYNRDRSEMDALCIKLNTKHTVVTTRKIEGIPCTLDSDLRLQDIAAISTHSRYIIAIFTGPICALYTTSTKAYVKKWFIITTNKHKYTHNSIDYDMITDGDLSSIYKYFNI
jgi:hypothetical protein